MWSFAPKACAKLHRRGKPTIFYAPASRARDDYFQIKSLRKRIKVDTGGKPQYNVRIWAFMSAA